ncbi:MAG: tetratricopeptide repeat protein, partial [Verrucomicrobiota bacterium]
ELRPATKREIIVRMLRNLVGVSMRTGATENPIHYLDTILALDPQAPMERWSRAMLRLREGDDKGGKEDLEWLLDHTPEGIDMQRVREIYRSLR